MTVRNKNKSGGFTLIELLLYVSLSGVIILMVSIFLSILLQSRVRNQVVAEVEQQGIQVMQIITQIVRNAQNINSPVQGAAGSLLSLDVVNAIDDPAIFNLNGSAVQITEGAGLPVNLTSSRVIASDLNFQNLSKPDTPGIVRIWFTLSHINPQGRNEYNYSKTFYGSISLR